jgi:hypothetical protein
VGYTGYIGYTGWPLDVRLREHVLAAQRGYEGRSYSGTRSPKLIWLEPRIVPLLYGPADARHWPYVAGLEKRCIATYTARGWRLANAAVVRAPKAGTVRE